MLPLMVPAGVMWVDFKVNLHLFLPSPYPPPPLAGPQDRHSVCSHTVTPAGLELTT